MKVLSVTVFKSKVERVDAKSEREWQGKKYPAEPAYDQVQIKAKIGTYLELALALPKGSSQPTEGEVLQVNVYDDVFNSVQVLMDVIKVSSVSDGEIW